MFIAGKYHEWYTSLYSYSDVTAAAGNKRQQSPNGSTVKLSDDTSPVVQVAIKKRFESNPLAEMNNSMLNTIF